MELKEITEYLGINADNLEAFKTEFDKEFVKQSNITEDTESVKKILGKTFNTLETEIKKVAKGFELEVDFNSESLKGTKVTDKLKFVVSEIDKKNKSIIDELTVKAGQGNDERIKELEEKYSKAIGKAKDYEGLLKTRNAEFETFQASAKEENKKIKLDIFKQQALSNVKFKADINEVEKAGYLAIINQKYNIDLDENEKPIVFNKENKRIPNTKVNGSFLELEDVLQSEAVANKLFLLNPDNGKPKPIAGKVAEAKAPINGRRVAARL